MDIEKMETFSQNDALEDKHYSQSTSAGVGGVPISTFKKLCIKFPCEL